MGSITQNKLPLIDFSKLAGKPGSTEWEKARDQVKEALIEYGCFEATFDGVPIGLKKALLGSLKELFDLPFETKMRNTSQKPYHGYIKHSRKFCSFESFGIDEPDVYDKVNSLSKIFWPEGNPKFSETIQSFSEKLSLLERMVRRMVVEGLGLEKYVEEHLDSTSDLLRIMKYIGPWINEAEVGISGHTDKNMLTILCQNKGEGLEVKTKDGDHWIPFKPTPQSFIVIVGDSLHAWTNGRLLTPHHRVMLRGDEIRYSVGFFTIPKAGYVIKAPGEIIDDDHPLLFKPFEFFEFLGYYDTEAGRTSENALKDYCGV